MMQIPWALYDNTDAHCQLVALCQNMKKQQQVYFDQHTSVSGMSIFTTTAICPYP